MRSLKFQYLASILLLATLTAAQVPLGQDPVWQSHETGVYSTGMIWRDCNLDGWIDLFFSNGNDMALAQNTIYLSNNGILPLSASWLSNNFEYSGHCAVGDIDDNGYPDFVVANYLGQERFSTANHSQMYQNTGGVISTTPNWQTEDSLYTFSCALGDVDNDGDLDLAFATGEAYYGKFQKDLIYFNIDGELQTTPGWQSHDTTTAYDVTWGDVDNDGDLDLAFCYESFPTSIYYNQNGIIDTLPGWQSSLSQSGNTLVFGDVNGDGWLDLIVAYNGQLAAGGHFRAYFNDGTGTLYDAPLWQSYSGGYGSAVALYDYDNDGDDDLAAGRWWDQPRIYENTGTTFTTLPVWRANLETVVEELAWVDVDQNGVMSYTDTILPDVGQRLFYTLHHPLYSFDSIMVDGTPLNDSDYCFDPIFGWITTGVDPTGTVVLFYKYSTKNDLAVANWGEVNDLYPNTTTCCGKFTDGFTGNTNCDTEGGLDLADITRLIDRVYITKTELCCEENGNVNGDPEALINLADITRLIDHVYISKTETAACF